VARPGSGRRLLFSGVLALATLLAVEAASWLALWGITGQWPSPSRRRDERARARAEAAQRTNVEPAPKRKSEDLPDFLRADVLHPYLGFVQDPGMPIEERLRVTAEGFVNVAANPPDPAERFTVAVFGGSVAEHLTIAGRRRLAWRLARIPALAGKKVWVESFALGGYKQPQQLAALTWALARGERLDLVINLDGFNDVVLPVVENLPERVNPFYPREWARRAARLPDPEAERLVGEIAYLESRRVDGSGRCERGWLAASATCHLLWRSWDRALAGRTAALREKLAGRQAKVRTFLTSGPPFAVPENKEDLYRSLAEFWGRSSELMYDLCRSRGIPYFHFLQPNQYVPGSKPMGRAEREVAVVLDSPFRTGVVAGYPQLVAVGAQLRRRGVPFYDLTGLFAKHPEPLYIDTCCHLNRDGNLLLAGAIARTIAGDLAKPGG
jgi:hypothetical protein